MPYWYDGGTGFAYWWIFPLVSGSLWLILIGVAIWLGARWTRLAGRRRSGAQAILQGRFARGEIDADAYHQRMRVLEGGQ